MGGKSEFTRSSRGCYNKQQHHKGKEVVVLLILLLTANGGSSSASNVNDKHVSGAKKIGSGQQNSHPTSVNKTEIKNLVWDMVVTRTKNKISENTGRAEGGAFQ